MGKTNSFRNYYWPEIYDYESAKKAVNLGAGAGFFCAGATLLVIFLNSLGIFEKKILDIDSYAFLDVIVIASLAYGTKQFSRFAAVSSLIVYWAERIYAMSTGETLGGPFMVAMMTVMFISGIRGAFAFHQFKNEPPAAPTDSASYRYPRYDAAQSHMQNTGYDSKLQGLGNIPQNEKPFDPIAELREYDERKKRERS